MVCSCGGGAGIFCQVRDHWRNQMYPLHWRHVTTRRITRQCSGQMVTDFDLELRKPSSFVSIRASDGLADGVVELTYRVRGLGHTSHRSYIGTDRLQPRSPHCLPRRILEARSYSYKTRHHYTMSNNSPSSSTPEDVPRVLARNTACLPCR